MGSVHDDTLYYGQLDREKKMSNIATIVPGKTDKELAEEFKIRIAEAHKPLFELFDEIDKAGFSCNIGVGKGPFGKHQIMQLQLVKTF